MRKATEQKKKKTFCKDCLEDPEECSQNPIDCMKKKEANLYFQLYGISGHQVLGKYRRD